MKVTSSDRSSLAHRQSDMAAMTLFFTGRRAASPRRLKEDGSSWAPLYKLLAGRRRAGMPRNERRECRPMAQGKRISVDIDDGALEA
ncbi:hypothetical protein, partial [Roseateles sp.]|uniref:hypothetical protein n=1 Tax=Roseateles sp. TaxID=1971397 RepID=UPI002F4191B3